MTGPWTEASRIGRRPSGVVYCENVLLQYSRPEPVEGAIEKALTGSMVFVRREDAPVVLAALAEQGGK